MNLSQIKPGLTSFVPLVLCLASTFYLVGLIWVIQLLQYPLMAKVGEAQFQSYHLEHTNRIVLALSLPVLLSLGSSVVLLAIHPAGIPEWMVWLNLGLNGLFWIVTAVIQIPIHTDLSAGFNSILIQTLVDSNWWRTLIWTVEGFLLLVMLGFALNTALK